MDLVKTHSDYNLYLLNNAHDTNETLVYRAFCVLKTYGDDSGFIPTKVADRLIRTHLGARYNSQVLSRLLESSKFWTKQRKGLRLASWSAIADLVDSDTKYHDFAYIPVSTMSNKRVFVSHLYGAWLITANKIDGDYYSRKTITELTGISKKTQIRYEKKLGITNTEQFIKLTHSQLEKELALKTVNETAIVLSTNEFVYLQVGNAYSWGDNPIVKPTPNKRRTRTSKVTVRAKTAFKGAIRLLNNNYHSPRWENRIRHLPTFELSDDSLMDGKVYTLANGTAFSF
jgi:hypothetical protein